MDPTKSTLANLLDSFIDKVKQQGIRAISLKPYRIACKRIRTFATTNGEIYYSPNLLDRYLVRLDEELNEGKICFAYHRFQKRTARMFRSLAETGEMDFSRSSEGLHLKYPISKESGILVENILDENEIKDRIKNRLRASMQHIFHFAEQSGLKTSQMDDAFFMRYIVEEIPKTNSCSTGKAMRCVRYTATYLKNHCIASVSGDYSMLKLRAGKTKIIPAFNDSELKALTSVINDGTPKGKRDLAIVLLGGGCGLRGSDITSLRLADIDWRGQKLRLIQPKTHSPLVVAAPAEVMNALADYVLNARPKCDIPEVFVTITAPYRRIKTKSLGTQIDKYSTKADIKKIPRRSFHSLRRYFMTTLVSRGVPIGTASQMIGHKSIEMDKPYITHNRSEIAFVALSFSDVPLTHGLYAKLGLVGSDAKGGSAS